FAFEVVAKLDPAEILPVEQPAATALTQYSSGRSLSMENIGEPINLTEKVKRKQNARMRSSKRHYLYDVALSFAKEDRGYAEDLANILQLHGIKVFYDKYDKSSLWGKNLYTHLSDIYQNKAQYCVMFLSRHYANTLWTNHERDAAQARAFREKQEYILPLRLDGTHFPGILPTTAYLSCPPETIDTIANIIVEKLSMYC
ncbi:MAG TPA: TIR domain-containing protein, partial [Ktedonobacteraceae bacterium]|nr:TIR domain-containing protein [Ktedonobacteraceae bacterium]